MNSILAQGVNYNTNTYANVVYTRPTVPAKSQLQVLMTQVGIVSGTLSALFIIVIVYSLVRMAIMQKEELEKRDRLVNERLAKKAHEARNPRWELIQNLLQSSAEADWRVAIIEADVLLEEALKYAGFNGSTVGEMLSNANPKSFSTYQFAWEAHKVRNDIAHIGSQYTLTKDDVVRTLNMYRSVLEEFGLV